MKENILRIIKRIENSEILLDKDIESIVNNSNILVVKEVTNCIGHLTLSGKNSLIRSKKEETINELYSYLFYNTDFYDIS